MSNKHIKNLNKYPREMKHQKRNYDLTRLDTVMYVLCLADGIVNNIWLGRFKALLYKTEGERKIYIHVKPLEAQTWKREQKIPSYSRRQQHERYRSVFMEYIRWLVHDCVCVRRRGCQLSPTPTPAPTPPTPTPSNTLPYLLHRSRPS